MDEKYRNRALGEMSYRNNKKLNASKHDNAQRIEQLERAVKTWTEEAAHWATENERLQRSLNDAVSMRSSAYIETRKLRGLSRDALEFYTEHYIPDRHFGEVQYEFHEKMMALHKGLNGGG